MLPVTTGALPVAVLDADRLDDDALRRLAVGASIATLFSTTGRSSEDTVRWSSLNPAVPVRDGGAAADVRAAIVAAAARSILVLATAPPSDPGRFVARAVQGAAAATEYGVPGVAVHVLREGSRLGPVAWLSQTGSLSGYGVLFAVGFAQLHGSGVVLVEPAGGLGEPRTPEARDEALRVASAVRVDVLTVSDPSPVDRVLRDRFALVVHPVLDVKGGRALLRPDELPRASVADGNPAALVRLLEEFEGDVVAVFDGVRLLHGDSRALQLAAGVVLATVAAAGLGVAMAPAASAAGTGTAATAVANTVTGQPGVTVTASGHNGASHTGVFHVVNRLAEPVTLQLVAVWTHSGNHPDLSVPGPIVTVAGGSATDASFEAPRPTGVTGQGGYHIAGPAQTWNLVVKDSTGRIVATIPMTPGGPLPALVQSPDVTPAQLAPQFRPVPEVVDPPEEVTPVTDATVVLDPSAVPMATPGQVPVQVPVAVPMAVPGQVPQVTTEIDPPDEVTPVTDATVVLDPMAVQATLDHGATRHATGARELAHTGAGETALLAGLAAAMLAAGAGLVVAGRAGRGEDQEG